MSNTPSVVGGYTKHLGFKIQESEKIFSGNLES